MEPRLHRRRLGLGLSVRLGGARDVRRRTAQRIRLGRSRGRRVRALRSHHGRGRVAVGPLQGADHRVVRHRRRLPDAHARRRSGPEPLRLQRVPRHPRRGPPRVVRVPQLAVDLVRVVRAHAVLPCVRGLSVGRAPEPGAGDHRRGVLRDLRGPPARPSFPLQNAGDSRGLVPHHRQRGGVLPGRPRRARRLAKRMGHAALHRPRGVHRRVFRPRAAHPPRRRGPRRYLPPRFHRAHRARALPPTRLGMARAGLGAVRGRHHAPGRVPEAPQRVGGVQRPPRGRDRVIAHADADHARHRGVVEAVPQQLVAPGLRDVRVAPGHASRRPQNSQGLHG